jgi:amidase
MTELTYLPARELAHLIRQRECSATEALEAFLDRIDRYNPTLNAVVSANVHRARAAAAEADRALARGDAVGPLHGVPMTLKDGHDVAGLRTTVGAAAFDAVPEFDGTVAARLQAAGAIILGHTNVPPYLMDYRSENEIFGRTSNPWDLGRTAGGSSGGAAAALAAGLTPVEVGSDLAGSLRVPPHFCGVYGLKATEQRVPMTGYFRHPGGGPRPVRVLSALGPMARDLDDLELVLRLITGPDGRDMDVPPVPLGARRRQELTDVRLAVAPALPGTRVDPSLRKQIERTAAGASDAGARVIERLPDIDWSQHPLLFRELLVAVTGAFDPAAELSAEHRSLAWYLTALDVREHFAAAWQSFFDSGYDALLLPPAATTAFAHEAPRQGYQGYLSAFANFAGLPALTVPAGHDEHGLPVGVQLAGPRWSELRLLDIAAALERAGILPGFTRPPGY